MTSSATTAIRGAVLGGMVAYKLPGDKPGGLDDVNAGVSFGGDSWCTAVSTRYITMKMSTSKHTYVVIHDDICYFSHFESNGLSTNPFLALSVLSFPHII